MKYDDIREKNQMYRINYDCEKEKEVDCDLVGQYLQNASMNDFSQVHEKKFVHKQI